jgi:hypothetical protein
MPTKFKKPDVYKFLTGEQKATARDAHQMFIVHEVSGPTLNEYNGHSTMRYNFLCAPLDGKGKEAPKAEWVIIAMAQNDIRDRMVADMRKSLTEDASGIGPLVIAGSEESYWEFDEA